MLKDTNDSTRRVFECQCGHYQHAVHMWYDPEIDMVEIEVYVEATGIWQRIKSACAVLFRGRAIHFDWIPNREDYPHIAVLFLDAISNNAVRSKRKAPILGSCVQYPSNTPSSPDELLGAVKIGGTD